jgi:PAS domain S-box-containing protein
MKLFSFGASWTLGRYVINQELLRMNKNNRLSLKIGTKLTLGYLIIALLSVVVGYFGVSVITNTLDEFDKLAGQTVPTINALEDLRYAVSRIISSANEFAFDSETGGIVGSSEEAEIVAAQALYKESLTEYEKLVVRYFPDEREALEEIRNYGEELQRISLEFVALRKEGASRDILMEKREELEDIEAKFLAMINETLTSEDEEIDARKHNVNTVLTVAKATIISVNGLMIVLAVVIGYFIARSISRPLIHLKEAAEAIRQGHLETPITVESSDEVGVLAGAFKQMVEELAYSKAYAENIIRSMVNALIVVNHKGVIETVNQATLKLLGYTEQELLGRPATLVVPAEELLNRSDTQGIVQNIETVYLAKDGRQVSVSFSSAMMRDGRTGQIQGIVCLAEDITERKRAAIEREELQQQLIAAQQQAIQELSTPIIPVMDQIIIMPLVGHIDTTRAGDIMRSLLAGIRNYRAKVVILDVTGVPVVDSSVASHLDKTIQAARLKGARTIITGLSDQVAETLVELGINWSNIETVRDLQTGLRAALKRLGLKLTQ